MDRTPKAEGFPGQRIIVLPRSAVARARQHPLLCNLLPTDVGYFPKAAGHLMHRPAGVSEAIFIYCVQGHGWCELHGKRHQVETGDLLVVPPQTPHTYAADAAHPWTVWWVHAAGANLGPFLSELGISVERPVLYLGENPQLIALFEEVLDVVAQGYAPTPLLCASQALAHLIGTMILHRHQKWRGDPDPKQRVSQSIAYMKQHIGKPLRVPTLAALANLSSSHYTALFKEHTGYAPIDYLIRLRMHKACQMLDTTTLTVKEIADALGYSDPFYFSRLFKVVNDTSPAAYRLLHKG